MLLGAIVYRLCFGLLIWGKVRWVIYNVELVIYDELTDYEA